MTASQQPTGHDKAVERLALHLKRTRQDDDSGQPSIDDTITAGAVLAVLRAALAAGDADVAEALDVPSLLAAAKAEALRDAADEWQQGDWIMVLPASLGPKVIGLGQRVTDWLRARADRAEA